MPELLVVLTILVALSGVVLASIGPAVKEAKLRATICTVVAQLRYARAYAISHSCQAGVLVDYLNHGTGVVYSSVDALGVTSWQPVTTQAGRFRTLPEDIAIGTVILTDPQSGTQTSTTPPSSAGPFSATPTLGGAAPSGDSNSSNQEVISFSLLGQGDDVQITLQDRAGTMRTISVAALTGQCAIMGENGENNGQKSATP